MCETVRILHVDDERSFVELSAHFLTAERASFVVTTETDARSGLSRLEESSFDCIVSDYQMPDMDGLEFLRTVRATYPSLPFILYTGEGSETVAADALAHGVTDYLQKQTGTEQYQLLANRIENAVESYRTERELKQYKTLVETVGDAMYILDADGVITLANDALATILDCTPTELVGMHASEFLPDGGFEAGTELIVSILDDPASDWGTYEVTVETANGKHILTEINLAPLRDNGDQYTGTVGVVRDLRPRNDG